MNRRRQVNGPPRANGRPRATGRVGALVAATAGVGGAATVVVPQHAASIAALAAATVVVVLALLALVLVGPLVDREPPRTELDAVDAPGAVTLEPPGLRDARRDLAAPATGPVPRATWDRLVVAAGLRSPAGVPDLAADHRGDDGRPLLSASTRSLLATPPEPGGHPSPVAAAAVVHRTLDELDRQPTHPGVHHGHR